MKKMKNDNKGFTLVELIVVLVILAILAAILVPALLGYIDEAKQKQIVLEGKSVYTAAQAWASEMYAKDLTPDNIKKADAERIIKMADVTGATSIKVGFVAAKDDDTNKHGKWTVNYVEYKKGTDPSEQIFLANNTWSGTDDQSKAKNIITIFPLPTN